MAVSHLDARSGKYRYLENDLCRGMPFFIQMAGFDRCQPQYRWHGRSLPYRALGCRFPEAVSSISMVSRSAPYPAACSS